MNRDLTRAELNAALKSLRAVGSPYDFIAAHVEADNEPHVIDDELRSSGWYGGTA